LIKYESYECVVSLHEIKTCKSFQKYWASMQPNWSHWTGLPQTKFYSSIYQTIKLLLNAY
jgi:hypothetical protein